MSKIRFREPSKSGKTFDESKLHFMLSDEAGQCDPAPEWPTLGVQLGMASLTDEQRADLDAMMASYPGSQRATPKLKEKRGKKYTKPKKR